MFNISEPHGIPTMIFGFNGVPMHVESYDFFAFDEFPRIYFA